MSIDGFRDMYNDFYGSADDTLTSKQRREQNVRDKINQLSNEGKAQLSIETEVETMEEAERKPVAVAHKTPGEDPEKPKEPEKSGMEELEEESEIGRMDGISVTEGEVCAEELQDLAAMDGSGEVSFEVTVPVPGMHMVYNALAAAAVGRIYGLSTEQIRAGIESIETIGGRMNRIRAACGLIVDDCYNANPVSMKASIDVMKDAGTRRVLILGDMGELGENEDSLHREVGAYAAASGAEVLLFVGALAGHMTEGAGQQLADGQQLAHFDTVEALLAALPEYIREGDTILVKASRFMKLEKVVDMLKEMPGGNI